MDGIGQIALRVCALLGWLGLAVGFVGRTGAAVGRRPQRAWGSLIGLAIQTVALAIVWGWRRPIGAPFIPAHVALDWLLVAIAGALAGGADWLVFRAVRGLGRQWSLDARVLADHQLVTTGAYAIVRHPIYTGIYALLAVTGFAFSTWGALLTAIPVFWLGTNLRVASEERLLRATFGDAYDAYVARVPAVVPRLWAR